MHRVLDHYLHTAMTASHRFSPFRSPLQLASPQPGVLPAEVADKEQAMAWFDAEVPVLLALIAYADASGFDTHAWQIPWTLGPFFNRRGRWRDYTATQQTALAAASRLGDTLALAHAHHLLGHVQSQMGDYEAADPNFRRALDCSASSATGANEAVVLNGLAGMLEKQERYPEALAVALDALRMLKAVGHWWTQATLENGVGWLYAHLGQYDQALTHCQRALSLHRDSGHRGGTADTLDSLGYVYLHLGDYRRRPRPTTPRPSRPTARSARRSARATRWPGSATPCWPRATRRPPRRPGARPSPSWTGSRTRSRTRFRARLRDLDAEDSHGRGERAAADPGRAQPSQASLTGAATAAR